MDRAIDNLSLEEVNGHAGTQVLKDKSVFSDVLSIRGFRPAA
jgi:hypothetical protein